MISTRNEKKHVLLIEDDHNVAQMLKILLETRDYTVNVANCGQEALQIAHAGIDIILLDILLPDIDGFQVCRKLKESNDTRHIPIVILSAKYLFEDKVEGLYLGADDYLTKPFEHEELFARMEAVMRRGRSIVATSKSFEDKNIVLELRRVIEEELIVPYFQPIYYLRPFKLMGLEILSRPQVDGVLSSPENLFRAALKYGLYHEMELLSWKKALKLASHFLKEQLLFFNCNPYLIEGPKFLMIKSIFDQNNILTNNVILEITERSRIANYKVFYEHLREYREHGFRFAVDDVGGGFASLESIVETRPEIVKIDRHIINDLHNDPFKKSIIQFVVSFCKENGIISVAEGIENQAQLDMLMDLGVDAGQGYYLYKPTANINLTDMCKNVQA